MVIKPDWRYIGIENKEVVGTILVLTGLLFNTEGMVNNCIKVVESLMVLLLLFEIVRIKRMVFILTEELMIYRHGLFTLRTDFIELYRVVDFIQKRSLLEQLTGLKTVTVVSGDYSNRELIIPGVRNEEPLVNAIRERVEMCKKNKGIYEITNRY